MVKARQPKARCRGQAWTEGATSQHCPGILTSAPVASRNQHGVVRQIIVCRSIARETQMTPDLGPVARQQNTS